MKKFNRNWLRSLKASRLNLKGEIMFKLLVQKSSLFFRDASARPRSCIGSWQMAEFNNFDSFICRWWTKSTMWQLQMKLFPSNHLQSNCAVFLYLQKEAIHNSLNKEFEDKKLSKSNKKFRNYTQILMLLVVRTNQLRSIWSDCGLNFWNK